MSNENPTFAEMIALLDGPISNTTLRINDQRRAVLLQALRIADGQVNIPHATDNEKRIVGKLVTDLLAAGLCMSVNDGESFTLNLSRDPAAIYAALSSTGEDYLFVHEPKFADRWVRLIWGNDVDVISDYHVSLEKLLAGANALANELDR